MTSVPRVTTIICLVVMGYWSEQLSADPQKRPLKIGIVGCDSSHAVEFTKAINGIHANAASPLLEVTVAYAGGSGDIAESRDRIQGFVEQLKQQGITMVESTDKVVEQSDAILLESVDGRVHLEQFRSVARGKPVFVDKPAAATLAELLTLFQVADATQTPCFTSSAVRYIDQVKQLKMDKSVGDIMGCDVASPFRVEAHHAELFWYGIHGVEALYATMGTGCETVSRVDSESSSVVIGKWQGDRIGTFRGLKQGKFSYVFTVYGKTGVVQSQGFSGYKPLVEQISEFFLSHKSPVGRQETIEIFAFMEAAAESKRLGGQAVSIRDILNRAERDANSHNLEPATSLKH